MTATRRTVGGARARLSPRGWRMLARVLAARARFAGSAARHAFEPHPLTVKKVLLQV